MTENIFTTLSVYFDTVSRSAALNMAIDEALLEGARAPEIRFYRWDHPAASFGYFGRFEDAARIAKGRDLVRRWTGGGIVFHGTDLTYAIVVPGANRESVTSPLHFYSAVHSAIRDVALGTGSSAILADGASEKISESCFAHPVRGDVMIDGKKIAGAAQRRTRNGLLQQGSIQMENLPADFAQQFAGVLCSDAQLRSLPDKVMERGEEIAQQRYARREWLERR